ncbi:MAG: hypothetical protein M1833_001049 [Piccolia ochrophora]|nr:MAG: hypothetical protein M1833_001049 [Piccolia ochrophora]
MHSKLILALLTSTAYRGLAAPQQSASSIITAAPAGFTPQRGTFENAAPLQNVSTKASLNAPNPHKRPDEQPDAEADCIYTYEATLNSTTGVLYGLYDRLDSLRFEDIQQGGVGDCGLGASVLALIGSNRWEARIAGQYDLTTGVRNAYFDVEFVNQDGTAYVVQIDDTLPVTTDGKCWKYIGFQVTQAANNQMVLYMPLIEKAWAKYLDAKPELKSYPEKTGYLGLEGSDPGKVLQALTGWEIRYAAHAGSGPDTTIAAYTLLATLFYQPTVFSSPSLEDLETLGSSWDAKTSTATLELGTLAIVNAEGHVMKYTRYSDGSEHYVVATHAYALTPDDDLRGGIKASTWQQASVVLRNPWGVNPSSPDQTGGPPTLKLTIGEVSQIFGQIWSVLPPWMENPRAP